MDEPWCARARALSPQLPGPLRPKGWDIAEPNRGPAYSEYSDWLEEVRQLHVQGPHLGDRVSTTSRSRSGYRHPATFYLCCGLEETETECSRLPFRHHVGTIRGQGSRRRGGANCFTWTCCGGRNWEPGCTLGPHPSLPLPIEREVPAEVRQRDKVFRNFIQGCTWDRGEEFGLVRDLLSLNCKLMAKLPYIYDYEWEVVPGHSNQGKGDLVLTDGRDSYLIVEMKWLTEASGKTARTKRNKSRKDVVTQAIHYAKLFGNKYPDAKRIIPATYTNEGQGEPILKILKDEIIRL